MATQTYLQTNVEKNSIDSVIDINRYNDLLKLYRVTAYVLQFINNIKWVYEGKMVSALNISRWRNHETPVYYG